MKEGEEKGREEEEALLQYSNSRSLFEILFTGISDPPSFSYMEIDQRR